MNEELATQLEGLAGLIRKRGSLMETGRQLEQILKKIEEQLRGQEAWRRIKRR